MCICFREWHLLNVTTRGMCLHGGCACSCCILVCWLHRTCRLLSPTHHHMFGHKGPLVVLAALAGWAHLCALDSADYAGFALLEHVGVIMQALLSSHELACRCLLQAQWRGWWC